jgi:hypothetical protein
MAAIPAVFYRVATIRIEAEDPGFCGVVGASPSPAQDSAFFTAAANPALGASTVMASGNFFAA